MILNEIVQKKNKKEYKYTSGKVYSNAAIEVAKRIKDRKQSMAHAGKALYED